MGTCKACEENCQVEEEEEEEEEQEEEEEEGEEGEGEEGEEGEGEDRRRRRKLVEVDCDTCQDECDAYENLEDNGMYDATDFIECQMIYDPEDDGQGAYYAGPMCASNGEKIKIGVFSDENCYTRAYGQKIDSYLVDND